MRPLRGVVVEMVDSTLVIELESGATIKWPKVHGLNTGKRALVTYDLTTNKPKMVLPYVEAAREREINVECPIEESKCHDDDDAEILVSGALPPSCDGEFWNSDFWDSGALRQCFDGSFEQTSDDVGCSDYHVCSDEGE